MYATSDAGLNPQSTARSEELLQLIHDHQNSGSSFRATSELIQKAVKVNISHRTTADIVNKTGNAIREQKSAQREAIFKKHNYTSDGRPLDVEASKKALGIKSTKELNAILTPSELAIAVRGLNDKLTVQHKQRHHLPDTKPNLVSNLGFCIENPSVPFVTICIDEVQAKRQDKSTYPEGKPKAKSKKTQPKRPLSKTDRRKQKRLAKKKRQTEAQKRSAIAAVSTLSFAEKRPSVYHTVAVIRWGDNKIVLHAPSVTEGFKDCVACLLENGLMGCHLVFFIDGAKTLITNIDRYFGYCSHQVNLDWHHAVRAVIDMTSRGLCLKDTARDEALSEIKTQLWLFNWQKAKAAIINLKQHSNTDKVRHLDNAINYIDRKKSLLTCYALRKELRLINSSNAVEKHNDLIVSARQKGRGMSWSRLGSNNLAAIKTAAINGQLYLALSAKAAKNPVQWFRLDQTHLKEAA